MALYRIVREDGSVEYTDTPSGNGRIEAVRPGSNSNLRDDTEAAKDYETAKTLIKEAQKRIPKISDYLEYLEYLRHYSPREFDRVMRELAQEDRMTWVKLQRYPQFRPLKESLIGYKAGEKMIGAGIGMATGSYSGTVEKWMESTLKDLMKRDRFGPYAPVLGSKASTLPTKTPTYSNSRLGQYLKAEDARLASAAKSAASEMESARAGLHAARGTVVTRALGPILDIGVAALNPETYGAVANTTVELRLKKAYEKGILDDEQYVTAHNLMAAGKFREMTEYLKSISMEVQP